MPGLAEQLETPGLPVLATPLEPAWLRKTKELPGLAERTAPQ